MKDAVEKIRIKLPPIDLIVTSDTIEGWAPSGWRIKLIIDEKGYLVEEPKYLNGAVVPRAEGSQDYTGNKSLIDYRVRLRPKNVDPEDNSSDPPGCRLLAGRWY